MGKMLSGSVKLRPNPTKTIYILAGIVVLFIKYPGGKMDIFSLVKEHQNPKRLKEEFFNSYIDFARKLDEEGYRKESNCYMSICDMCYDLMDRPEDLIEHESFFADLFNAFDRLLHIRINRPWDYEREFEKFLIYKVKMQEYYYGELAVPSAKYDEEVSKQIISHLAGDL